ncbi:MAG: hypothetical protein DHS20C18_02510 [Saprospiraceae bacterium]|nr:MAG: hypothetical protein DHS20C18_02510 [Saprospiraceae bacterium]
MEQKLRTLIGTNKTKQAIQELLALTQKMGDPDMHQEVIMQSARFEKFTKSNRLGISSHEEENISIAKINKALLDIIERLPESGAATIISSSSAKASPATTDKSWWKYVTATAVIIGILGSLAEVFNFINLIPASSGQTSQLTIYVHGPGGLQDYVLENEGELLVDLDGDRRFAKIGEKGRTVFSEIPAKFIGQSLPIAIQAEGYEAAASESQYKWEEKAIYFKVQRAQQLRKIQGIVKSMHGADFLADVLVMIENEFTTTTDSLGRFSFEMPANRVREKYTLTFQKTGYESLTEFYYPQSSPEFRLKKQ